MLSFVIPAHDEELLIGETIRSIRAAVATTSVSFEIIVVDDASTDRTAAVASTEGARIVAVSSRHIAAARNAGARDATGDTLVFVDADTLVTAAVMQDVVSAMNAGAIGGGAIVTFDQPLRGYARAWAGTFTWLSRRFRLAAGCFLFCSKEVFDAVGGFDETYFVAEEIVLSRTLNRQGKFVILPHPVVTSARKLRTHTTGEILRTFLWLAVRPGAVRRRGALGLWYGPRRKDRSAKSLHHEDHEGREDL